MDGAVAIVLAAGGGERLGLATPKAFVELAGRPMLVHAAAAAASCPEVGSLIVVVPRGLEADAEDLVAGLAVHAVVAGGTTRGASVRAALGAIPDGAPVVVCHDAARPFASPALFASVLRALPGADGVVPVVAIPDTVKRLRDGVVESTEDRSSLALAQTPQAFDADALAGAHADAERDGVELTDDAAILERAGYRVLAVDGEPENFKITTPQDLARAERVAAELARG